jgi:hypothetical protein
MSGEAFITITLWPFSDEFAPLETHPDESIRREFESITSDSLAVCDAKTARLKTLAARAEAVQT